MDRLLLSWLPLENWHSRFHQLLPTLALLLAFVTLASSVELPKALRSVKCQFNKTFLVGSSFLGPDSCINQVSGNCLMEGNY